jgi:hypothetical protein
MWFDELSTGASRETLHPSPFDKLRMTAQDDSSG